jgi:iron complex transport system substrate-binding protein
VTPHPHPCLPARRLRLLSQIGLLLAATANASSPPRVVSINLCTDQLVLQLADLSQIASLTWMASDAEISQFAARAVNIPINHGLAEEILPLKPDLVLAGKYTARYTVALLRKFNYRVMELDLAHSFDEVAQQTIAVATALGQHARGEAAVQRMRARLAAAVLPAQPKALAVMYQPNGFTAAAGSFVDEIFNRSGLDNLARRLGLPADHAFIPMETLIHAAPDVLVLDQPSRKGASIAAMLLQHPAMRRFATERRVIELPATLTACATTESAAAVEALTRARR